MTVKLTARAEADLEEIGDYNAQDNRERAISFVEEIIAHCLRLPSSPPKRRIVRDFGVNVQRAVHGNYNIYYTNTADATYIQRIANLIAHLAEIASPRCRGLNLIQDAIRCPTHTPDSTFPR